MTCIRKCACRRWCIRCYKRRVIKYLIICTGICVFLWTYIFGRSDLLIKPCIQERLDPWDTSVMRYFSRLAPIKCSRQRGFIYLDGQGVLRFNDTLIRQYKLDKTLLQCSFSNLRRGAGDTANVTFDTPVNINLPVFIKSHMFRVTCINNINVVEYDFLHFNMKWNKRRKDFNQLDEETEDKLSVVIFGIDSVSRSHAMRSLPKSFEFLKSDMDAYDFEGYSKIGENTWRNFIPLLAGKSHRLYPVTMHMLFHTDSIPFLWYEKELRKVSTFYAEDRPEVSAFTVFGQLGFNQEPTDYYFRPFTQGVRKFNPKIVKTVKNDNDCYGPKTMFQTQIDYLKGYMDRYENKRKFAMTWNTQVSHSNFNSLSRIDDSLLGFLKWMNGNNRARHTIFIVMSDHGPRLGDSALTHVGRAECNKPWLMMVIPSNLKLKYSWLHNAISKNSEKLTSHYDMYQTMFDLFQNKAFVRRKSIPVQNYLVRRNLFHPLPDGRTCADAGIEAQYCTCERKTRASLSSKEVKLIAEFLVNKINDILSSYSELCYTYILHNVTRALVTYSAASEDFSIKVLGKYTSLFLSSFYRDTSGRYTVMFYTKPGDAYFEGTVDFAGYSSKENGKTMVLVGEPIRLDRYGDTSTCVKNPFHRPYCICKQV